MTDGPEVGPQPLSDNQVFALTPLERAEVYLALKLLRVRIENQNRRHELEPETYLGPHAWDPAQVRALGELFRS